MSKMPAFFISHGGGPWPWIDDMRAELAPLEASLADIPKTLPERPKAVLMVSGHWETNGFSVMSAPAPKMVYDYYNFPPHTYEITYPAPGAPDLATRAAELISGAQLPVMLDAEMGYDHGTFVPMQIMYPGADMPLFQVSIEKGYDPAQHLALGRALEPLRDEGVLIVGSGLSYHNLGLFGPRAKTPSTEFDIWLSDALEQPPEQRTAHMLDWEQAPSARVAHKDEDHLVPLWVALGASETAKARKIYYQEDIFGGVTASSWRFDD